LMGLGLQGIVLIQTIFIDFLISDLLNQQLFELHFSINELFLNVPENA
jgi:hypothetical protein